jgi:hypothetical protein
MPQSTSAVTIDRALDDFLAAQRLRLSDKTYRRYADVVALLRDALNHYAHQGLSDAEQRRWQKAYDAGEEGAFCALFGPEKIAEELGSFLGWFMVRKVIAGEDLLRTAGTVTKKLARWLEEQGYVDAEAAADALERGGEASRDLPAASRLTDALSELCLRAPDVDVDDVADENWVEDSLPITRVEPGRLWVGEVGPIELPKRATEGARVGWEVWVVAARVGGRWHLLENGFVYP